MKCRHGVYIASTDWSVQAAAGIPAAQRIAWHCWLCREFGAYEYSTEALLELARANSNSASEKQVA